MTKKEKRLKVLQHQLNRLERRLAALRQRSERYSRWRLILFSLGGLLSGWSFLQWGPEVWLGVTAVAFIPFIAAVVVHRRVDDVKSRFTLWQQIKQDRLARMTLDWDSLPPERTFPVPADHPFAVDLDVIGRFSLHRLLDTAVAHEGSRRLHDWLLELSPVAEAVEQRQQRVRELAGQTHFRQRLALEATLAVDQDQTQWAGQALVDWLAREKPVRSLRPVLLGLTGLAGLNWLLFIGYRLWQWPALWLGSLFFYGLLFFALAYPRTSTLFSDVMFLTDKLRALSSVFALLEGWSYRKMPLVRQLCQPFLTAGKRPSSHVQRIQRIVTGIGLRQNWLLGFVLNLLMPWDVFMAYRLDQCRQDLGRHLPQWLDIWYELEAMNSLAAFAFLNPGEGVWPLFSGDGCTELIAAALGHPFIPSQERVCNDVHLDAGQAIYLITGSNMAGKSSFLRALGVNLVLAYAGGPAVAQSFKVSWLRLFATIRVADSLSDGFSFFYAEVRRLAQLLQALNEAHKRPLLFLIDEIFRGTNNRERLMGSRAYIAALVQGDGLGAIATHDLELVQLAEEMNKIKNVHFRDEVIDGRMVFDYRLHDGPCPTTNALKIMQLAGLPVPSAGRDKS